MHRAIVRSGWRKSPSQEQGRRAEFYYQQLDALRTVRQQVRRDLLAEGKKHKAWKLLCQIPSIGPISQPYCLAFCKLRTVSTAAAAMDVQRIGHRDTKQRRSP